MRLDLDEHRNLGDLIGLTFTLFGRHLAVFLSLTLLVVAPIEILVDGVWGGFLADANASAPVAATTVSFLFGPADALRRIGELVEGRWWRVLGLLVVFNLITGAFGAVGRALIDRIDSGALFMTSWILLQTVTLSLTAIFGTLLFFRPACPLAAAVAGHPAHQPRRPRAADPVTPHLVLTA